MFLIEIIAQKQWISIDINLSSSHIESKDSFDWSFGSYVPHEDGFVPATT